MVRLFLFLLTFVCVDVQSMDNISTVDLSKLYKVLQSVPQASTMNCCGRINTQMFVVTFEIDIIKTIQNVNKKLSDRSILIPNINELRHGGDYTDDDFHSDFNLLSLLTFLASFKEEIDAEKAFEAEESLRKVYNGLIPEYSGHIPDEDLLQLQLFFLKRLELVEEFNEKHSSGI